MIVPEGLVVRANASMNEVLDHVDERRWPLPADLERVIAGGVTCRDGRIVLAASTLQAPDGLGDDWTVERWINDVSLVTALPAQDERWRAQLLGWAMQVSFALVPQAVALLAGGERVQADVCLQSAAGRADPDLDFATGAMHLYRVRTGADDLSSRLDGCDQPVLTVTARRPA